MLKKDLQRALVLPAEGEQRKRFSGLSLAMKCCDAQ